MAATVSLKFRDEAVKPPIKLQVLIYPVIQLLDTRLPSMKQNAEGPVLNSRDIAYFKQLYLEGKVDKIDALLAHGLITPEAERTVQKFIDLSKLPKKYLSGYSKPEVGGGNVTLWNEMKGSLLNKYLSPLFADRLNNLPSAYIYSAEFDQLRDEAFLYANRLQEAGVKVLHRNHDIGFHGIFTSFGFMPEALEQLKDAAKFITDNI